jgi:hypothetical protein
MQSMFGDIKQIERFATQYSKNELASLAQQGLLPAQTAVLAGMMQDRMQAASIPTPQTTVAEKVLGTSPTTSQQGIASVAPTTTNVAPQTGINQPTTQAPTQMAYGGLAELDTGDMYKEDSFAGGGIVAFANKGYVDSSTLSPYTAKEYEKMSEEEKALADRTAIKKKGLAGINIEDTPATRSMMQTLFGTGAYGIDMSGTPSITPTGELSAEKARLQEKIKTPTASTYGDIERLKEVESGLSGNLHMVVKVKVLAQVPVKILVKMLVLALD